MKLISGKATKLSTKTKKKGGVRGSRQLKREKNGKHIFGNKKENKVEDDM